MGIQMKQKKLADTFMMILNWKKPFDLHNLYKNISALQGFIHILFQFHYFRTHFFGTLATHVP